MKFSKWLDTLVEEKEIDVETVFNVDGKSGTNHIPLACVIDAIKQTSTQEQMKIKDMLVRIDFVNGNIIDYFRHLAKAIAI